MKKSEENSVIFRFSYLLLMGQDMVGMGGMREKIKLLRYEVKRFFFFLMAAIQEHLRINLSE